MADEHKQGRLIHGDEIPKVRGIARLKNKWFRVKHGTSCRDCAFQGLGHVVCPEIKCAQHDRSDGHPVVYEEVKDGDVRERRTARRKQIEYRNRTRRQFAELHNSLCSAPLKTRLKAAWRIITKKRFKL